jgi:uncharacterized membrane protein YkoI
VLVIVAVLLLAFVVARGCQQSQVRITEEQAIATAQREVDFEPRRTQIRLLREGINSRPYWIVSLSVPGEREGTFRRLATVKINANSGKVEDVNREI